MFRFLAWLFVMLLMVALWGLLMGIFVGGNAGVILAILGGGIIGCTFYPTLCREANSK